MCIRDRVDTASLSVGLGLFNLVPIPPLDGSKVLAVLLPDRAYNWLMRYERFGMLAVSYTHLKTVGVVLLQCVVAWLAAYIAYAVGGLLL